MITFVSENENTSIGKFCALTHFAFNASSRKNVYSKNEFKKILFEEIEKFADGGGKFVSFDVFDTVLLRNEKSEIRRFYEISDLFSKAIADGYGNSCNAESVLFARYVSTKNSYSYSKQVRGCREGRLEEIHLGIVRMLNVPDEFSEKLTEIELDYEIRNVEPNPFVRPTLDLCEKLGLGVVLISDMYMGGAHIHKLLNSHFPGAFQFQQIYSSGDLKISKRSGHLFDHVVSMIGVSTSEMLHFGDNELTDVQCARERGLQTIYLPHSDSEYDAIKLDELTTVNSLLNSGLDLKIIVPY